MPGTTGPARAEKSIEHYKRAERQYVDYKLHVYSRNLIDFCIKHQAGTFILLDEQQKEEIAKEEEFLLRNWSYYELLAKIKYKAEKTGMEVVVG